MFDLDNLSIAYEGASVLQGISLRIEAGEKVVIIGPSGVGKSTLLKRLYELRPRESAFIHQDYALVPQLSAFHNVFLARADENPMTTNLVNLLKPRRTELDWIIPIFETLQMEEKTFERVNNLSGGQQQRVAVGRAIYRHASIILGDEPVSSIDPHQAGVVLELIKGSAPTVVLAMHDVQLALEHFPRIIGLKDATVYFDLPASAVDESTLADLYLGETAPTQSGR